MSVVPSALTKEWLTTVPTAPSSDPADAVMARPEVPEEKRNCPSCGTPVGRGRGDAPGRTEGYCPKCRADTQHIILDTTSGSLYYDADGAGGVTQIEFARLGGAHTAVATDFVIG